MIDNKLVLDVARAMGYPVVKADGPDWYETLKDSDQELPFIVVLDKGGVRLVTAWRHDGMTPWWPTDDLELAMECLMRFCDRNRMDGSLYYDSASGAYEIVIEEPNRKQWKMAAGTFDIVADAICKAIALAYETIKEANE